MDMKTSSILTIIKNEHQYLDEWIRYHLDLGIDHIFIFEDYDSESHQGITAKYGDKISLSNVTTLLSDLELEMASSLKASKKGSAQLMYAKRALFRIQQQYEYDWCFIIDPDEFITFENTEDTLDAILYRYIDYDALCLSWECYGANGLIQKPDYSIKGVVDIYTTPATGPVPRYDPAYNKKTCYNLRKYKPVFWWGIHLPSDVCNYCNTEYVKDKSATTYKVMYLRHYVTKSWEEYVWKKTERGYFMGKSRTFDAFFIINPELLPYKEELIAKAKKYLVVLPYSDKGAQGKELELALSGWKKYCQSRYHFVVIGQYPEYLINKFDWVEFISTDMKIFPASQYAPHIDIQHKMEEIYNRFHTRFHGFIWMVDDNYAVKPFHINMMTQPYKHSSSFTGSQKSPTNFWSHDKWKTRQLLDEENLPHINYTSHFPCYFDFENLKAIWDKYDMRSHSYVIEDLYFNTYAHKEPEIDKTVRLGVWNKDIFENDFKSAMQNPDIKFVCNSTKGWSPELEEALGKIIYE